MRTGSIALVVTAALLAFFRGHASGTEPDDPTLADELTLKAVGLATDGPALLEFFRKRSQGQADAKRLKALVDQLSDNRLAIREQAAMELVGIGPAAIPWLRQVVHDPDKIESAGRARRCLQALEGASSREIVLAAARMIARRKPAGAVAVMLGYLPHADNDAVVEEVKAALSAVASRDDKPDPVLIKALEDDRSLRRAVAVDVLCETGAAEPRALLLKLLKDPSPLVRMHAGIALANVREQAAVATLINLLTELPPTYGKQVEEYLFNLAGEQAPKAPLGADADSRAKCQAAWNAWWTAADGAKLLDEVRKRILRDADRGKVQTLIKQLGDDSFLSREKAQTALLAMGTAVVPALRQAAQDPDVEVSNRAKALLERIEKDKNAPISPTTLRLVAFRKPPGSTEALLGLLPFIEDESTQEELQDSLTALAFPDGKADAVLVAALKDKAPLVRGAVAEALCQPGAVEQQAAVRKLLTDADGYVRLKAALALAYVRDREAIPHLITLLGELPTEKTAPAEEYLIQLAGERAPVVAATNDAAGQKKRQEAWATWWKEQGPKVELLAWNRTAMREHYYGYTLICLPQNGQIIELGTDGKQRWQLSGLSNPWDFQVLPGHRVLVAEYGASRVSERNLKGDIVWQKQVGNPISCQRLSNGHTFIATRNQLLEVDRSGKEVFTLNRNSWDIMSARKLRDGQIVMVSQSGCHRLDASGKELRSYQLPNGVGTYYIDISPKGSILLAQSWMNKVYDYDPDGKLVTEINVNQPWSAFRLPNGNTLVSTQNWPAKVLEVDKTGKTVWEHQTPTQAGRVKRR
jgi:HEAT repeat protein